ncbi:alkaline phosphatase family protein [Reichenbachiella sp.]|uniref:alkaline phosphatase family protein n=1 Tax=Reichenbachiella sp. TaxID=2184521 RepID=UPI0032986881
MINQKPKPNVEKLQSTIKHVVVLMLENRSFDNLLGWLYEDKAPYDRPPEGQEFEGLTNGMWNPLDNLDTDGIAFKEKVLVERNGQPKTFHGKEVPNPVDFTLPKPDPGEGFKDTNYQLFQEYNVPLQYPPPAINTGFVQNYQNAMTYGTYSFGDEPANPRSIMKCYTPDQTPVLSKLARNFAVCDQYYCSVPSQTLPNRDFVHAATSTGYVNNGPKAQCDAKTIFNQIQDEIDGGRIDLSWGIFGNNISSNNIKDKAGKFGNDHFSLTRLIMTKLHDPRFERNFGTLDEFKKRCAQGNLPSYSFLEPNYGGSGQNDQHPPSDIRPGEQLIADIYNAVRESEVFEEILLIITYDEHGGCYDHVPPPGGAKNPDVNDTPGQDGFLFNRFGVRVPCMVINPYIKPGLIARSASYIPFDHTSIIKTVQNCFKLKGHLTERDKAAPDFSGLLTLDVPNKNDVEVEPLQWDIEAASHSTNELHRLIGTIMEELTGSSVPQSADLLEYIQESYNSLFKANT